MPLNKKILSSLITTLLIVSILAIPAPYVEAAKYEDLIDTISPDSGPIGVTVTVNGTAPDDITEDYPVKIYWSYEQPEAKKVEYGYAYSSATPDAQNWKHLETVEEPTKGTTNKYEVDVTVPDVPPNGATYYIVAWQDVNDDDYIDDGEWDYAEFTVVEGLDKTEGNVGDEVVVGGWDTLNPGGLVLIYWDTQAPENKLGEVYSKAGYNGSYTITVTIPETVCGTYSIIVVDANKGTIATYSFELKPEITLSPDTALEGDTITVSGTGFGAEKAITLYLDDEELTTSPSDVETDENGSFGPCTFKVPEGTAAGDHTVKAEDEDGNEATATLTIGPAITLSPTSGPTGTIVEITGRGFTGTDIEGGEYINITIDGTECPLIEDIKVRSDGRFSGKFVIPTVEEADTYTITAWVHGHKDVNSTADFEVTGISDITVTPTSGAPGSTITIEGVNFTAKADIEITIDFGGLEEYATTKTNATGGFLTAITVPSVPVQTEAYTITATDEYGLTASADFRVALTTLAISQSSGPTGTKVLLIGGGLTPETSFNVTIDGELMIYEGTFYTDKDGNIESDTYVYVPTVPVGTHTITVMDEEGITATATFEVTATTEIVLTPSSAPRGYNVTFELNNFYHEEGTDIDLTIYNVTADGEVDWEMDLDLAVGAENFTSADVETNATGCFVDGWFVIPASFAIGDYYINATDEHGLTAEVSFSVVEPTVIVYTGADEYMRGDTVAFFAKSSFSYEEETINLYTPDKFLIEVPIAITTKVGELYTGSATYLLPADAETGVWFWNTTISGVTVNGTFTVVEKPTIATLREDVSRLKDDLADLAGTVSDLSDIVEDLSGVVEDQASDISKLSDSIKNLKDAIGDLSSSLDKVKGDIANLSTAVSEAQSSAKEASEAASSAESTAAGISTAVYLAVILSLIAAVAAIMSIIFLQRKIAG